MKRGRSNKGGDVSGGKTKGYSKHAKFVMAANAPMMDPFASAAAFDQYVAASVERQKAKNAHYVDLADPISTTPTTYDFTTGLAVPTEGIHLLATVPQNNTVHGRQGKKGAYKSLQIKGVVQSEATTSVSKAAMVIVYDRKPRDVLPNVVDIFTAKHSSAMLNDANSDRFQIVRRLEWVCKGAAGQPESAYNVDEYVKLQKRPIEWGTAGTGEIGDITKGALYVVFLGSTNAGTTDSQFLGSFRTRFIDIDG